MNLDKLHEKLIAAARLEKPGDQVPAIRNLAEQLFVNPNTIARAYRELILEGFLDSKKGDRARGPGEQYFEQK